MPFCKTGDILRDAYIKGYGVVALNCFNFESISYAVEAAEDEKMPIIIMLYPAMRTHMPLNVFAACTKEVAKNAKVPVGLHLDHCDNYELLLESIHAGFNSVIIDASKFDYGENLRMTKEVSRAAHAMDCEVEAELGHVGSGANLSDFDDSSKYTDPAQAAEFVRDAGVDYLAVAVGNGHGNYVKEPIIDIGRVKELKAAVPVPLVMHGGSGIPDDQLANCVRNGVSKFNYGTYYFRSFYDAAEEVIKNHAEPNRNGLWLEGQMKDNVKGFVKERIRALNPDKVNPI